MIEYIRKHPDHVLIKGKDDVTGKSVKVNIPRKTFEAWDVRRWDVKTIATLDPTVRSFLLTGTRE